MAIAELVTVAAHLDVPLFYAGRLPRADLRAIAMHEGVPELHCLDLFGLQAPQPGSGTDP